MSPRLNRTEFLKRIKRRSRKTVPSLPGRIELLNIKYVRARERRKWRTQVKEAQEPT